MSKTNIEDNVLIFPNILHFQGKNFSFLSSSFIIINITNIIIRG